MKKILVFQHIEREHPNLISDYARGRDIELEVMRLWEETHIPNISPYDGLIVLGGPMGVYDVYPNKKEELHALANAIGNIPVLGICLGAQLLAHALGASVYPYKKEGKQIKQIGYYDAELTVEGKMSPLFKGLESPLKVLQWHGDTFDLPKGAKLLATDPVCPMQAFSYENAYGMQFHVEATPKLVREWLEADSVWVNTDFELNLARILMEADENASRLKDECYAILDNLFA